MRTEALNAWCPKDRRTAIYADGEVIGKIEDDLKMADRTRLV